MTAIRLPVSFWLAGLVTLTLFWFLGMLISEVPNVEPVPTIGQIEFTNLIPEEEPVTIVRVPPPIRKPVLPPDSAVVTHVTAKVGPGIDRSDLVPPDVFIQGIEAPGREVSVAGFRRRVAPIAARFHRCASSPTIRSSRRRAGSRAGSRSASRSRARDA